MIADLIAICDLRYAIRDHMETSLSYWSDSRDNVIPVVIMLRTEDVSSY